MLEELFTVVWLDNATVKKASEIGRDPKAKGELIEDRELIVDATAIVKGLRLLTRNAARYPELSHYDLHFYAQRRPSGLDKYRLCLISARVFHSSPRGS